MNRRELLNRLGGGIRSVAQVVTPLGWIVLIAAPSSLAVGYAAGWIEFVTIGFASLILLVGASLFLLGRGGFSVELDVSTSRVVVGQPAVGVVTVTNPGSRRVAGGPLELPVGAVAVGFVVPSIARGTSVRREFEAVTDRRGVLRVGPVRSVRADPVGLFRREVLRTGSRTLFVHPRTVALPGASTGLLRDLEGAASRDLTNSDVAFHALREYVAGDERRYIHWKSTAKTGVPMVRQFEETRRSRLAVVLSLSSVDYSDGETGSAEFELAVSSAGSLGLRAIRDSLDISVLVGDGALSPVRQLGRRGRSGLLDDLAGVSLAAASPPLAELARAAATRLDGVSVVYLVCGAAVTPLMLRAATAGFAAGMIVVAIVCDPGAAPDLARSGSMDLMTIGRLDDLQHSLVRAAGG